MHYLVQRRIDNALQRQKHAAKFYEVARRYVDQGRIEEAAFFQELGATNAEWARDHMRIE